MTGAGDALGQDISVMPFHPGQVLLSQKSQLASVLQLVNSIAVTYESKAAAVHHLPRSSARVSEPAPPRSHHCDWQSTMQCAGELSLIFSVVRVARAVIALAAASRHGLPQGHVVFLQSKASI